MSNKVRWPDKDPADVLDYKLDWLGDEFTPGPLAGTEDTIANSLWIVPSGLSSENEIFDDTTTTVWLSGGQDGTTYGVLNRITTFGGRTIDQTVFIKVRFK